MPWLRHDGEMFHLCKCGYNGIADLRKLRWSSKHEVLKDGPSRRRRHRTASSAAHTNTQSSSSSLPVQPQGGAGKKPAPDIADGEASSDPLLHNAGSVPQDLDTASHMGFDGLWPDLDDCSYGDLGLSDNFLLELDLQYSHQELTTDGMRLGEDINQDDPLPDSGLHEVASSDLDLREMRNGHGTVATRQNSIANAGQPAGSTAPGSENSLLQTYYRLSEPGQVIGLTDESFVDYYFENVCSVLSCFDSAMNPFRSVVEQMWTNSAAMYLTIQSMAIGHLANYYPYLAPLGLEKRSQAWKYLQRDLQSFRIGKVSGDSLLMTLLMLGLSSSWHQPSHLGMQYLLIARDLMQRRLQRPQNKAEKSQDDTAVDDGFFGHALMYWEMLISFVDPVPLVSACVSGVCDHSTDTPILPFRRHLYMANCNYRVQRDRLA